MAATIVERSAEFIVIQAKIPINGFSMLTDEETILRAVNETGAAATQTWGYLLFDYVTTSGTIRALENQTAAYVIRPDVPNVFKCPNGKCYLQYDAKLLGYAKSSHLGYSLHQNFAGLSIRQVKIPSRQLIACDSTNGKFGVDYYECHYGVVQTLDPANILNMTHSYYPGLMHQNRANVLFLAGNVSPFSALELTCLPWGP